MSLQTDRSAHMELSAAGDDHFEQMLKPCGERVPNPLNDRWINDLTDADLASLYQDMVVIRRLDTEATALQRQGELALWPPLLGQEASQVGAARALQNKDFIFPSYRESGVLVLRGVSPTELMRVWRGSSTTTWNPYDHNVASPQIIIGAQTHHAVGYAMGLGMDGEEAAAVSFFGDGATSQGDVNEAMVFAATYHAPAVFFCQNNHWAISEPVGLQSQTHIADRARGFGIPAVRVDGNDVLAVLAVTRRALEQARHGGGPFFIEAVTYRMGPHTTADDPTRYRDQGELEHWKGRDPLDRMAKYLAQSGADMEQIEKDAQAAADEMAAVVRAEIKQTVEPTARDLFTHVYSEEHPRINEQRDHYEAYLQQFGDSLDGNGANGNGAGGSAGAAR
ncbi:pyruvate dehydrogenase E1 component alpha subunit [Neomicrococcus aestuarii]|uniref:Pyruvate dehydrogenase E1 component alpha subunit n=2 Tax=Neomicrococcus aestuarii TaxID=556325 RepID=A0A7W8WXT1_9MICC|nr:pyruvate dehydrogenase E1 component alpha subunit [Neomicrococcus aestuarii]